MFRPFADDGFQILNNSIDKSYINDALNSIKHLHNNQSSHHHTFYNETGSIRSIMGITNGSCKYLQNICKYEHIIKLVKQLLKTNEVHIHQFKINIVNSSENGWSPHVDYDFWKNNDNMLSSNAITICTPLTPFNEITGGLYFEKGSHKTYTQMLHEDPTVDEFVKSAQPYTIYIDNEEMYFPSCNEGDIIIMSSMVKHGSVINRTDVDRVGIFITYTPSTNACNLSSRPWYFSQPLGVFDEIT
jgi:ectoine hydroxylase-related dioxygenase (phytanoyl-CoA dioxygenase family)